MGNPYRPPNRSARRARVPKQVPRQHPGPRPACRSRRARRGCAQATGLSSSSSPSVSPSSSSSVSQPSSTESHAIEGESGTVMLCWSLRVELAACTWLRSPGPREPPGHQRGWPRDGHQRPEDERSRRAGPGLSAPGAGPSHRTDDRRRGSREQRVSTRPARWPAPRVPASCMNALRTLRGSRTADRRARRQPRGGGVTQRVGDLREARWRGRLSSTGRRTLACPGTGARAPRRGTPAPLLARSGTSYPCR